MKLKNGIIIGVGILATLLGAIGIFLPIWPTTPFVLLAIGCFSRAPKLREKLLNVRFFREYYEGYIFGVRVPKGTIYISLTFLWIMMAVSSIIIDKMWITIALILIGVAVTAHILYMGKMILAKGR